MKSDRRLCTGNSFCTVQSLCTVISWGLLWLSPAVANAQADDLFRTGVQPYIQKYCVECHNQQEAKADLDLTQFQNARDVIASFRRWNNVVEFIHNGEMPPRESLQPSIDESNAVVAQVHDILITEARKQAGDPGMVLPRRLSNTEYDLSVRDLTGIDIRPTRDFPPDPAAGEGFDNTGEALGMSPNLLKKYLSAAQLVSDHLVLKTSGLAFAPYPVTSYNERKKFTEQAIIDFYQSHNVDTLSVLEAAWRYRHRPAEQKEMTPEEWALSAQTGSGTALSPRYLSLVFRTLNELSQEPGLLGNIGRAWDAVPPPVDSTSRPQQLKDLLGVVEFYQRVLKPEQPELIQANAGNWPIRHLDFRAKVAASRDQFSVASLRTEVLLDSMRMKAPDEKDRSPQPISLFLEFAQVERENESTEAETYVIVRRPMFSRHNRLPGNANEEEQHGVQTLRSILEASDPDVAATLNFGKHPEGDEIDADSFVVKSPRILEIPLTAEMLRQLNDKNFLVQCQLDTKHSPEGGVFVRYGTQNTFSDAGRSIVPSTAQLLIHRDSQRAQSLVPSASAFFNAFPDRFFYVDSGRGLAAGFHLVEGFFRDDRPLVEKVLNDDERQRLDQLWQELDFVTESSETLLRGFVWFERSEREVLLDKRFDFLNAEDPALVEDSLLDRFQKAYLDKMGVKRIGDTLEAEQPDENSRMIRQFFTSIHEGLQRHQELIGTAEAHGLQDLDKLTQRAFRRTLQPAERDSFHSLYQKLRADGLNVEAALRGVLTAVLMSPEFCYHYHGAPEGSAASPLSDYDLASRLSFFLWSSLPDEELLTAAEAGKLQNQEELLKQTHRMLTDEGIAAFSREFFGQWLRYRDYLSKDPILADAFPGYDEQLRQAIFEEPVQLATHLIQTDQPITELLTSDKTFVNRRLAQHYGPEFEQQYVAQHSQQVQSRTSQKSGPVTGQTDSGENWYPVTGLKQAGRGGLFGMAVVLTKNSAGERTSPVKRGFWSVHHLLGQHFPPPPADVPELPKSEKLADQTIRQLLAAHVADQQCAMCHRHFDGLGVAMEGFDAIGRRRSTDSAGRAIDNVALLPNGETAEGIPGLIRYVEQHRRQDFIRTLCRKFLGYALGRSVILSDQPLLDDMEIELERNNYRFSVLFDTVIKSPQFRQQRGRDFVTAGR